MFYVLHCVLCGSHRISLVGFLRLAAVVLQFSSVYFRVGRFVRPCLRRYLPELDFQPRQIGSTVSFAGLLLGPHSGLQRLPPPVQDPLASGVWLNLAFAASGFKAGSMVHVCFRRDQLQAFHACFGGRHPASHLRLRPVKIHTSVVFSVCSSALLAPPKPRIVYTHGAFSP